MRAFLALSLIALFALPAAAGDEPATDPVARSYGAELSDAEIVPISTLLATPDEFVGKPVKLEGRITGVCTHRGCWIDLAGDEDFQSMRIKVEDGVIVFPAEAVGHVATAEGVFTKIELTPEQTAAMHKAECEKDGKSSCQHAAPDEAGIVYQVAGTGAVIQ
jgi:hypothetical protein